MRVGGEACNISSAPSPSEVWCTAPLSPPNGLTEAEVRVSGPAERSRSYYVLAYCHWKLHADFVYLPHPPYTLTTHSHTHTPTHSHTTCFQVMIGTNINTLLDNRLIYEVVPDPVALEIIIPAVISGVLLLTLPFAFIIIMVLCIMRRKQRAVLFNFEMTDREIRYYSKIRQPNL